MHQCRLGFIVAAALGLSVMQANMARADFFATFDYINGPINGEANPFAIMDITGNLAARTVKFSISTSVTTPVTTFNEVAFNTTLKSGTDYSISSFTGSLTGNTASLLYILAGVKQDGFGRYTDAVAVTPGTGNDLPGGSANAFEFTLHLTGAFNATTDDGLAGLFVNPQGTANTFGSSVGTNDLVNGVPDAMYFGAHIYTPTSNSTLTTGNTGWIASDEITSGPTPNVTTTPVPSSITMLASMLVPGLGFYFYRRRNAAVAA